MVMRKPVHPGEILREEVLAEWLHSWPSSEPSSRRVISHSDPAASLRWVSERVP